MKDTIIGLRFPSDMPPEECSRVAKKLFVSLFETGRVTYSQFLYPYADSLLLSEESGGEQSFFGTHSLLWNIDPEMPEKVLLRGVPGVPFEIEQLDFSTERLMHFFDIKDRETDMMLFGAFDELLVGSIRPWSIREQARKFCSFAEHISRMNGCKVCGTVGAYLGVRAENMQPGDFAPLYEAKTGRIMKVWNRK